MSNSSNYARTQLGDEFLVKLATDPEHPDVVSLIKEIREEIPDLANESDENIMDRIMAMLGDAEDHDGRRATA